MARSKIACVVDVHPVRDRVKTHLVAQGSEHIEELGLAVVAAVGRVHPVARVRELLRGHEAVGDMKLAGDPLGHRAVASGIRWRFCGNREGIFAQHPVRRIGEITRIDAARKRDQHATRGPKCIVEGSALGAEIGGGFHGAKVKGGCRAVNTCRGGAGPTKHYACHTETGGTMAKLRVGLLFGGRSVEHEVSLVSATSILAALDPSRYDVTLVAVDADGHWRLGDPTLPPTLATLKSAVQGDEVDLPATPRQHTLIPVGENARKSGQTLDVIFPVIHGRGGEDGSLQGLLELAGIPYVGSGVLGSAIQMDKDVAKRLLSAAGLPVTPGVCVRAHQLGDGADVVDALVDELGPSLFVKPANQGSSVGISKVERREELLPALIDAARYDTKILVERAIDAREIEVALLGNDPIEASVPGEIRTRNTFYDYDAKYIDDDTELLIPAPIDAELADEMRNLAIGAVVALEGAGLARVDFLLERDTEKVFINEVNSIPGFTKGSMYPLLWQASGIPYPALLDRLIELALERHRITAALETRYEPTR